MADNDSLASRVSALEREVAEVSKAMAVDVAVRKDRYQQSVEQRNDAREAVRDLRVQIDKLRDDLRKEIKERDGGTPAPLPKELLPYAQTGALGWLILKYLGIIP